MDGEKKKTHKEMLDDFWSFDELIPKKARTASALDAHKAAEPVDVIVTPASEKQKVGFSDQPLNVSSDTVIKRYVSSEPTGVRAAISAELEYSPENSLIHKVKVYRWPSTYNYYEKFCETAERLYSIDGHECPSVPYFSYVPQYNQLNREQLDFYFWWRTCARQGKYIDADYSYIILYAFEIINLSCDHDVAFLQQQLFSLWLAYREKFPRLDKLLPEWVFDFSLINKLPAPKGKIPLSIITNNCGTAEFYVSAIGSDTDKYINAILIWCSSYDYRKSRYYDGERKKLYDKYIPEALREALLHFASGTDGKLMGTFGYGDSKATRETYVGALCSYKRKRRIEIEFCSFSRSHELRYLVGDIVKFIENRLRAYMDIKSRLTVYSLSLELSSFINGYLENVLPQKSKTVRKKTNDEFEKKYEPVRKPLSLNDAKKIEDESWETTRTLVEAFDGECADEVFEQDTAQTAPEEKDDLRGQLGELYGYLSALYRHNSAARADEVRRLGALEETIVDRINEIATECIGDIIIDGDDGGWYVIEDYADVLQAD